MSATPAQVLGQLGEALAETYLTADGARILERNYRSERGEVDLMVLHEGDLVAVEVKTRGAHDLEKPEEAINWWKLKRLVHALTTYAIQSDFVELHWRVDLVAIETAEDGTVHRLEHIRDIYPP
jgi:putative endonuclease